MVIPCDPGYLQGKQMDEHPLMLDLLQKTAGLLIVAWAILFILQKCGVIH